MDNSTISYISLVLALIAVAIAAYAAVSSGSVRTWKKYFAREEQPDNLEEIIDRIAGKIKALEEGDAANRDSVNALQIQLDKAIQHVGIIRYNSNGDDGGNLSFSIALLNAHQSGIIITSLHGRQQNRTYSKQIYQGQSEQILSEEEKEAFIQALTKHT